MLWYLAAILIALIVLRKAQLRLILSRAKHRSLAGHARVGRLVTRLIPYYEYDETRFFCADDAPAEVAATRRAAFMRLAALFAQRFARSAALTRRSPTRCPTCSSRRATACRSSSAASCASTSRAAPSCESSSGTTVTDLDGNRFFDLAGSYGVNLFGYDFYKECIDEGSELVRELGPVLGTYHPVMAYNVRRLREISGLDEVSLHMSGTEAVMQAVRLARYHTRRKYLVRFCGAYHGWWGDVQPGVGNPLAARGHLHAEGHGCARRCGCCARAATSPACW